MDLRTALPWWLLKSGLTATYPPLEREERCEVAIIGGGVTGALLAHALTGEGVDVVVVDRRDATLGSTVASTGLLLHETDTELGDLIEAVGREDAVRSWQLGLEAVQRLCTLAQTLEAGEFHARETLYIASRRAHARKLRREFELRREHGFDVELLGPGEFHGPDGAPLAILSRGNAEIDPFRFTHALLGAACERGARIYDRTEVTDVSTERKRATLRTARGPAIRCRSVVYATGYESEQYLERRIGKLHSTFVVVSEPVASFDGWPERRLMWETARPYTYLRSTPDGRVMAGGADVRFSESHGCPGMIDRKARKLVERARTMLPDVPFEPAFPWGGTFGSTPDGLPRIGPHPDRPGTYFALGYGGNGITFATIAARLLTDRIVGRANPDAERFRLDR